MKKLFAIAFSALIAAAALAVTTQSASAHGAGWRHSHGGVSFCFGSGCYRQYRPYYRHYRPHYRQYPPYYRQHRHYRPYYHRDRIIYRYRSPRRVYGAGRSGAHYRWCHRRYRSYRSWDNTFQPYHGPRRPCYSPYR